MSYIITFLLVLGTSLAGCGTFSGSDKQKYQTAATVFWGPADTWHHLRGTELVDYAFERRIGGIMVEYHPSVHGSRDRNDQHPLPAYPEHLKSWNKFVCDAGGKMVVFLLNMNQRYAKTHSVDYFRQIAQEAKTVLDPECTWIEPTVEPHDEGDIRTNEAKYAAVAAEMSEFKMIMPAHCSPDGHVQPVFPKQRYDFLDCHTSGTTPENAKNQALHWLGPLYDHIGDSLLVITDGGPLLDPTISNHVYAELARTAKERNRYFVLYTDRYAPGDVAAHKAVIDTLTSELD